MSTSSQTPSPKGPAAEIRAAVEKLRKHLKHATDGPWHSRPVWSPDSNSTSAVYSYAHPTGTVDSEVVASGRIRSGYGGIRNPWNAEYIALMQPALGNLLADWLEASAKNYLTYEDEPECPNCGEGCGGHDRVTVHEDCGEDAPCACIKHQIAIARQINGDEGGAR